jgi:hypothetical protein
LEKKSTNAIRSLKDAVSNQKFIQRPMRFKGDKDEDTKKKKGKKSGH